MEKTPFDRRQQARHQTQQQPQQLTQPRSTAGKPESPLRTEQMTVWPEDEKMRADTPVTLTQGQTVINAERMESDNIIGEVRLQGQVRGTLYRNAPTPKP